MRKGEVRPLDILNGNPVGKGGTLRECMETSGTEVPKLYQAHSDQPINAKRSDQRRKIKEDIEMPYCTPTPSALDDVSTPVFQNRSSSFWDFPNDELLLSFLLYAVIRLLFHPHSSSHDELHDGLRPKSAQEPSAFTIPKTKKVPKYGTFPMVAAM